ncbi:MAG: discoidin domain-containing protein [Archangium sp.]
MRAALLSILLVASPAAAQNVLLHRAPQDASGLPIAERLTDAVDGHDGEPWNIPAALTFGPRAALVWDLGAPTRVTGAALQADNNDIYVLSVSDDGANWRELWAAPPVTGVGLRTRSITTLDDTARFVRLTAHGGDERFSVTELEVFGNDTDTSGLLRSRWVPRRPLEQTSIAWLLGAVLVLLAASRNAPRPLLYVLAALSLWSLWKFMFVVTPTSPDFHASLPWLRAVTALLAIAVLIRERMWRGNWPVHPAFALGGLSAAAALSMWCFLNLGTPQFFDRGQQRGTWLHHYDMRTYFPIAKYFAELRFDGVYAASVMAVADGNNLDNFDNQPIRDLRTHVVTTVREQKAHLREVRSRFSPERWAEFLTDMAYFRSAMSDAGFLGSMNDHGGNATPVWFMAARATFVSAAANDATMWRGVFADIALFALAILAIGWAWGPRTALLAVVIFGAMDFYQFGSNWFGATLRHDWLSLWAIGVALLKKRKFEWAGAALAWSAWIRAFPALTLITLSFPVIFASGKALIQGRRADALASAKPLLKVALGVLIASAVLVGFSTWMFGVDAWTEWLRKVQTLDKDNHLNNISFRTYVSDNRIAWRIVVPTSALLLFFMLRRATMHRAAAWGVALLPVVFNPANYYLHSMFLMVTLAAEQSGQVRLRGVLVWLSLLAMCVASYFTNLTPDMEAHFRGATVICFATLGALLLLELRRPSDT